MTRITIVRGDLLPESSVWLFKSPLAGAGTYCGGCTTGRTGCCRNTCCATHVIWVQWSMSITSSMRRSHRCSVYCYRIIFFFAVVNDFPSVLWHCWLGERKGRPVKKSTGKPGYWHQRAGERHDKPSQGNQELLVVRDKVGRPPGEFGVSKSIGCDIFPSVLWHC